MPGAADQAFQVVAQAEQRSFEALKTRQGVSRLDVGGYGCLRQVGAWFGTPFQFGQWVVRRSGAAAERGDAGPFRGGHFQQAGVTVDVVRNPRVERRRDEDRGDAETEAIKGVFVGVVVGRHDFRKHDMVEEGAMLVVQDDQRGA
ncbi:MAG: hypothetical protein QOF90_2408, partial [Acetobacteraceae bacterium]|nr:hypothetical protein [Acetobacteraceae bacterium]